MNLEDILTFNTPNPWKPGFISCFLLRTFSFYEHILPALCWDSNPYIVVAFIPILSCVHSCSVNAHTFTSVVTPPTHTFSYTNSPLLQAPYRASVHIYCTAWTSTRVCSRNPQDWDTANVSVTLKKFTVHLFMGRFWSIYSYSGTSNSEFSTSWTSTCPL